MFLRGESCPRKRLIAFSRAANHPGAQLAEARCVLLVHRSSSCIAARARSRSCVLFLLSAGERRVRAVYRHRLGPIGCGVGASMRWHGRHLLYSSADGQVAIVDANGRRRDLDRFAKALPRRARSEQPVVAWRADYAR
jgi:hypothetical protein